MRRTRQFFTKAHRWGSLTLGLLLLVVVLSGVILVLAPEIEQVTHPSLYDTASGPTRVTPAEALQVVHRELPDFETTEASVYDNRGAWEVHSPGGEVARVDETDGKLLGTIDREHGLMGFITNMHECGMTCEEYSGYVPFLAKPAQVWGFDLTLGNEGSWGDLILAVSGILLLILVISGLFLWWPRRRKVKRALTIRRRAGRYKLNYDLHKVVGAVALPALAIWAITGINFELPKQVEGAWYAVTPGSRAPESLYEFESKPGSGPGVSMKEAVADAKAVLPDGARMVSVSNPSRSEKTSYYSLWFDSGVDTFHYGAYPGNFGVYVDRYSGRARQYFPNPDNATTTNEVMQNWFSGVHQGTLVGWIPRLGWVAFGLTPLLLAITGLATWLMRRRNRRRKKRRGDRDDGSDGAPIGAIPADAPVKVGA